MARTAQSKNGKGRKTGMVKYRNDEIMGSSSLRALRLSTMQISDSADTGHTCLPGGSDTVTVF